MPTEGQPMSDKITLKEFAESVRVDPNSLLARIHKGGLTKYTVDSLLDYKDKEKIIRALSRPKQKLKRRTPDKNAPHKGRPGFQRGARPSAGPHGQNRGKTPAKNPADAQRRQSGEYQRVGQKPMRSAKGPETSFNNKNPLKNRSSFEANKSGRPAYPISSKAATKPVRKYPVKTGASDAAQAQSKEKKNKRTRSQEIQTIIDKSVQRYGIRVTSDDIAEIEEMMNKQGGARTGSQSLRREMFKANGVKVAPRHGFVKPAVQKQKEIRLGDKIALEDLAAQLAVKVEKIEAKIKQDELDTVGEERFLDRDTASLLVEELGHKVLLVETEEEISERRIDAPPADAKMISRPPIVTVMGHVDHGKTTLLDYLRKTKLAENEAGNITQHLGAYTVNLKGQKITFMDTPGHAAFSAMRARGAGVTDIVILVVAADEGIKPQTEEAIKHATLAEKPIVVALTKTDKPDLNTEQIRKELASRGLKSEEWGGDVQFVEISAKEGTNIDKLLQSVLVQAEVMDLKAATDIPARGRVLESRLDKNMGTVATLLVRHGVLNKGDIISSGSHYGRIKIMRDDQGKPIGQASPAEAAEIFGLSGVPSAGDAFLVCATEKEARKLAEIKQNLAKKTTQSGPRAPDAVAFMQDKQTHITKINLILKTDVSGSLEAIGSLMDTVIAEADDQNSLEVNIVSKSAGAINVTDVSLAEATDALILGFNVRPDSAAKKLIKQRNLVERVQYFSVIYELGNELQRVIKEKSMLRGTEKILGIAEVKEVFRAKTYGQIAGCMVIEGKILKEKPIRVLRDNKVIYQGVLESLRRFKEDVKEVQKEVECGIGIKDYKDVRAGDQIEVYDKNLPTSP